MDKMKYVGHDIPRTDGPEKVNGSARYSQDIVLPGMLYGLIVRSPRPHAYIEHIDFTKAAKLPGVATVLNLNKYTVRYVGEEILALAAESMDIAEDAAALVEIKFRDLPFVVSEEAAMKEDAPRLDQNGNVSGWGDGNKAEVEKIIEESAFAVENTLSTQVQTHACLETHSCTAKWEGDKLTAWVSTQGVHGARSDLAQYFEIPVENVEVICEYMGGGFGSKFPVGVEGVVAARLAKITGKPVKLMLSRHEEFLAVGNRPSSHQHLKLACDKTGKITAFWQESYGTGGISEDASFPSPYIYKVPDGAVYKKHEDVRINAGPARAMRAPGHPQANFAMEVIMDMLAEKAGMDAIEFRILNDPNESRHHQYRLGAEKIGWTAKRRKTPGSDKGPLKRGVGVSSGTWGGGGEKDAKAIVEIFPDGRVVTSIGTQDLGTGIRTCVHQVTADVLGIPMSLVTPKIGRTSLPFAPGSGGSITIGSVTPVINNVAGKALAELLAKVAPALGVSAGDLVCEDGVIFSTADRAKSMKWKDACALLQGRTLSVQDGWVEGFSSSGVAGCQFVEVEVDVETGRVKPIKVVAVQDFGLPVNTLTSRSQLNGGVIMGLSWAMLEDRSLDPNTGTMVNPNFENYKLLGPMEMPEIEAVIDPMPERGVIGLGEPAHIPTSGALVTAIHNATGVWVTKMPITPAAVLEALKKNGGA
ncbi:xanthine dehydrogenase family protein molybdopterin-binding subunit [bacterium]|nr:xanthine dehydrogenase family protein molybdopterin-binding subunit [bacterium]